MRAALRRLAPDAEGLTLAALVAVGALLCGAPLLLLARVGVTTPEGLSLAPLAGALESRAVMRALWNSLDSAFVSAVFATLAGAALALAIGLTDVRAKAPLVFLILLPMMIPPHVTAISWIQALGPSSPPLMALGLAPPPGSTNPLYSRWGVIALLSVQHAPLAFLIVRTALRTLPREMSDAARVSGAGPFLMLRRVAAPLMAPSLIAGFALAFVSALGNFGIPALLGAPARYPTLPVLIWRRLASFGPNALADVAVIAALVAGVAALAVALQMALTRRARTALVGPPQAALALRLGAARPFVEGALWAVVAGVLFLPLASLLGTALVRTYGLPLTAETLTLDHFREVLFTQSVTARAFRNSTLIAGIAALVLALTAALTGFFLNRPRALPRRAAATVATLADVAYAVPGIVLSIAFILAFIRPLPVIGLSLYNTLWIILLAYLAAYFSVALKPATAAYAQLDPALDDAARVSGAGFGRRMGAIFLPLTASAAASGAILVFLTAYNEITVSTLLWSRGNETIGTTIFNYEDGGYTTLAAAMSSVTVAATVALMLALHLLGRRLPAGAAPWRD
jgi:iron(III) transport system permease protein